MSTNIHPTAQVSKSAKLANGVVIGPYSIIFDNVSIGENTIIDSYVCVGSKTTEVVIGKDNHFFSSSMIGLAPQDLSYKGEKTKLVIKDKNIIRSFATIDAGTIKDKSLTSIGSNNLIMAYVHIAHDCTIKDYCILANMVQLAGHVYVEDKVVIGGTGRVSQKTRLGTLSYITGDSSVNKDVAPFSIATGRWASMRAVNKVGLQRAGFNQEDILELHKIFRSLLSDDCVQVEWLKNLEIKNSKSKHVQALIAFVKSSKIGLAK